MIVAERQDHAAEAPPLQLREGPFLRCPKCERRREEWDYPKLRRVSRYSDQTVDVLRCPEPGCGHIFAMPPRGS